MAGLCGYELNNAIWRQRMNEGWQRSDRDACGHTFAYE